MLFVFCYQFCTFTNPIFSTYFYLGVWLLAWLLCPLFDLSFSPPGQLYLLPPSFLLCPTLWIFLGALGTQTHRNLKTHSWTLHCSPERGDPAPPTRTWTQASLTRKNLDKPLIQPHPQRAGSTIKRNHKLPAYRRPPQTQQSK